MDDVQQDGVPLSSNISDSSEFSSVLTNLNGKFSKNSWGDNDNEGKNKPLLSPWSKKRLNFISTVQNWLSARGGASEWVQRKLCLIKHFAFGVLKPDAKVVQRWNQFFVISCLFAIFIDPLFFFLLSVKKDHKCILINWQMTKIIVIFRSITDFIYLMHMVVQFRLAFVVGSGDLVHNPRKIALHYLSGFFFLDFVILLPFPQIIVLLVLPNSIAPSQANYAKNLLELAVFVQYIPRLYRLLPLLAGQSLTNSIFESAWASFIIHFLTFVLAGHVVGSCWYLFGLQRVYQCLLDACSKSGFINCKKFIDCGHGNDFGSFKVDPTWTQNLNSSSCFSEDSFPYGIYVKAVNLTAKNSIFTRYTYSFFWGFQQISTLAGNQTPSYFVSEVLFTMGIVGLGLLLVALLIGNMQNILQGLGRRRLEMSLRLRYVDQWMSRRHFSEEVRRNVQEFLRYNWAATQGFDEEVLLQILPEDLRRDIRRELFKHVKRVGIFEQLDEPILDAIRERSKAVTYIKGGTILCEGEFVTKMVFIVRGEMKSIGEDGNNVVPLSDGDVCGEELFTWCLERSSFIGVRRSKLVSKRTVKCLTNVEAFAIQDTDVEQVAALFDEESPC